MKILSLYTNMPSSVALLDNKKIVSAVNEKGILELKMTRSFQHTL